MSLGSGMLVGMRINASMLLGAIVGWIIAPYLLLRYGVISATFTRTDVLFWVMWPATGMLVAGRPHRAGAALAHPEEDVFAAVRRACRRRRRFRCSGSWLARLS